MLEKIRLNNFQCHSKLEIELDDQVTTIVGASDRGKSAIIRALRWLARNVPQGEEFIQEGKKGTTVQAVIDEQRITRRRGSGTNTYSLGEDEYKAFGNSVPDGIQQALNLHDINFQSQHDSPFWFSLSAGEVSRQINSIVDLGVIDEALSKITKKVRQCQQVLQITTDRLEKVKSRRDELDWVVDADNEYKRIENLAAEVQQRNAEIATLKRTVVDTLDTKERRHNAGQRAEILQSLVAIGERARQAQEQIRDIVRTLNSIEETKQTISKGCPDFTPVERSRILYDECDKDWERLLHTIDDIIAADALAKRKKSVYLSCVDELNEATEGVCPVCGGDLDGAHSEEEFQTQGEEAYQEAAQ